MHEYLIKGASKYFNLINAYCKMNSPMPHYVCCQYCIIFQTPAGQVVNSSFYQDGQFVLLLDNPVTGGSYTCQINGYQARAACLYNESQHSTVEINEMKYRFSLIEAENKKLKERLEKQERDHQQRLSAIENQLHSVLGTPHSNPPSLTYEWTNEVIIDELVD